MKQTNRQLQTIVPAHVPQILGMQHHPSPSKVIPTTDSPGAGSPAAALARVVEGVEVLGHAGHNCSA